MTPWAGILLILGAFTAMWVLLRLARPWITSPELSRKLLHIGMGLVSLALPWVFPRNIWPVVVLAVAAGVMLEAVKRLPLLHSLMGAVLDDVDRGSWGDVCYPASVAAVFALAGGDATLFCIPMLVLSFADALAALIGVRYGTLRYASGAGHKSIEGSMAFFTVAFLSTHIPLLLFCPQVDRVQTLLIALTVALLVMLLEAAAWHGVDNLLIPLGAYLLLQSCLQLTDRELMLRLATAVAWLVFVLLMREWTSLDDGALIGAALAGYLMLTLGDWRWVLAPVLIFVSYNRIWPRNRLDAEHQHTVHAVLSTNLPGLAWLLVAWKRPAWLASGGSLQISGLLFPFMLSYACHLAMIGMMRLKHASPHMSPAVLWLRCVVESCAVFFVPFLLIHRASRDAAIVSLLALAVVAAMLAGFYLTQPRLEELPADVGRWTREAAWAMAGSAVGYGAVYML